MLSPKGLSPYFFRGTDLWETVVQATLQDIGCALDFIHGRGIYHGDVKDLIVVKYKDGNLEAKLTDFGSARRIGEEMNRFIGTPAFAHKHLHEKSKWHCKAQYELTSLGFTLVTILNGGIVPWAGFSRKPEGDDILKELAKTRQEAAKEILTKDG
mmetsp:Transcript_5614/g.12352  ORF Transcript_5614/g.12352 Transcript_5614/m.12352 type:complete len:155 (+) Transcript_5614:74-538(+)|eukprot:CAMPEP_0168790972 /NCGR_PEP_ID=MMETSP0725-20121227/13711_1 /TAXON_ID=265536 /ORGANISM="Amphiprora sp., Strain CCMP467" /LENGTH=154 /DNA_ID=CAMNT_0008841465 /DNA_START=85 /DNA_END=549 /DNA_ORIENTATION=+